MALSEPGKTRQRKPGSAFQPTQQPSSKRTPSISSIHSTNSSIQALASATAKVSASSIHTRGDPHLVADSGNSMSKNHERSKSDVTSVKLSAESSSVTSLAALKRGAISKGKFEINIKPDHSV